jgi:molecular chaperone DnaK (HSP70)
MPRIEVRFLIDANGILNVTARDARTGLEQSVEVKPTYGLTDAQVEAMIEESVEFAEQDFEARQVREARVDADAMLSALDRARQDDAWLEIEDGERDRITAALNELLLVYHAGDAVLIRSRIEQLNEATRHLAGVMMDRAVSGALKGTRI